MIFIFYLYIVIYKEEIIVYNMCINNLDDHIYYVINIKKYLIVTVQNLNNQFSSFHRFIYNFVIFY